MSHFYFCLPWLESCILVKCVNVEAWRVAVFHWPAKVWYPCMAWTSFINRPKTSRPWFYLTKHHKMSKRKLSFPDQSVHAIHGYQTFAGQWKTATLQASTLTHFSTCPFGQLTKKSTCLTQSFSCPLSFPDQSSIVKRLIKEKKNIFETLSVSLLDDIKLKSQIINL
jgi:hypothetical protein